MIVWYNVHRTKKNKGEHKMFKNYRDVVNRLRKLYPNGTRIRLLHMDDPDPVEAGTTGTIVGVDGVGTILVDWDNGRTLGIIPETDQFAVIKN